MKCTTILIALVAAGGVLNRTVSAQSITPRQRVVLNVIDQNADDVISPEELEQFIRIAIRQRAVQAGLDIAAGSAAFDAYIRRQRDATLNHASADGNDTISPDEI